MTSSYVELKILLFIRYILFSAKRSFYCENTHIGGLLYNLEAQNFVAGDQKSKMVKPEGISVTTGIAEEYMTLHMLETGGKINQNSPFC